MHGSGKCEHTGHVITFLACISDKIRMLVLWLYYQAIALKQLKSSTFLHNMYLDEETHHQGILECPFMQGVSTGIK